MWQSAPPRMPIPPLRFSGRARGQTVDWLLFSAGVHVLHDEHTSTVVPAHTLAAEALT